MNKDFLKTFKSVLIETGELFQRPPSTVTLDQFSVVAKGKVSLKYVRLVGYMRLRDCVAPGANTNKFEQKAIKDLLTKLIA